MVRRSNLWLRERSYSLNTEAIVRRTKLWLGEQSNGFCFVRYVRDSNKLDFKTCSRIFVFKFKYSFYSIRQGKSSPILFTPPISIEIEMNYPYLH